MSWFVVGGIAIGATAGAIAGSEKGGDDVWKGALIGGALGAAGGAGAGALAGGAGAGAAGAGVAGAEGAGIAGLGGAEAAVAGGAGVGAVAPAGAAVGGAGAGAAGGASTAGIMAAAPSAATAAAPTSAGIVGAYGSAAPLGSSVVPSAYSGLGAGVGGSSASFVPATANTITAAAPTAASTGGMGLGQAGGFAGTPAFGGSGASFGTTGAANVPAGGGILNAPGQAMGMSNAAPITTPEFAGWGAPPPASETIAMQPGQSITDTLISARDAGNPAVTGGPPTPSALERGFGSAMSWLSEPKNAMLTGVLGLGALSMFNNQNNETFGDQPVTQAGYSLSPDFKPMRVNPQQYRYRSSYADGGLTDLDVGQREMYTRQATDPVTMYAEGGIAGYARGGDTSRQLAMIDPRTQETPSAPAPSYVGSAGIYSDDDADTRTQDALAAAQTRMAKTAKRANVKLGTMQKAKPIDEIELEPVPLKEEKMASGGISSLGGYAHGGNARLLRGPGDGMSDDIPASIAGKQPARLADGEFVVPADVVSGLGNGSTEAGAKKLHKMMDKVRVDRTGTKKQGREIKAEKYIPGMAEGGIAHYDDGGSVDLSQYYVYDAYGNQVPMSTLQSAVNQQTSAAPAEVSSSMQRQMVDPGQFAVGGQGTPDYAVPGYTLTGNLGRWSNIAGEAQRAARPASLNQQVTQSYLNTLGRAPDQQGFNYWMGSGQTGPQIQRGIELSPEASQTSPTTYGPDYISNLYQQYLGRMPDQSGAAYWQGQLGGSMSPTQIASAIQSSPEAQAYQQATQAALAQAQAAQAPAAEAAPAAATTAKRGGILAVR